MSGEWIRILTRSAVPVAGLALAACSGNTTGTVVNRPAAATAVAPTLAALCVRHVEYWAGEKMANRPDQGFDYQEMGLVAGEYQVLADLVTAHKTGSPGLTTLTNLERATVVARCTAAYGPTARTLPSDTGHAWP
jgi:hypothetical protein